jgi:hypothetical protein
LVVFVAVNEGTLVLPLVDKPIAGFELVHVKVAPEGVLANVFAGTEAPAQNVKLGSATTVGEGFIVKVVFALVVPHSFVTATVISLEPIPVKVILPGFGLVEVAGVPPEKDHK